ncbi:hypothetical protein SAMN05216357_110159 [Porphyromonadaceae bacterium KH3CP3RA]|nr:hypothetical protein SAMN05216357_110159 [Porphyromonadaceae bacterium KH3CP3RA]
MIFHKIIVLRFCLNSVFVKKKAEENRNNKLNIIVIIGNGFNYFIGILAY